MLKKENLEKIEALRKRFPNAQSLTIPALWIAQEQEGWISREMMEDIARLLDVPPGHVEGVATFYTMFNKKPVGKYHVQVCTNVSCQLLGAETIAHYLSEKLNVEVGGTTQDGKFTLSEVECLGSCGTAPVMQVNDDYYEGLTPEKISTIIDNLR